MATAQLGTVLRHIQHLTADQKTHQQSDGELLSGFVSRNDQAAFEVLVRRHGPMVLRLCRRWLGNVDDAEDVFQATFLVLARQAASIRKKESLASWLHGVAYRMATNARKAAARRHQHEQQASPIRPTDPACSAVSQEIQAALDAAIHGLPETYREPFVLCCLEHKSCAEAAGRLGLNEAAVRNRLTRARKLLQQRLARRGVSLTAALAMGALSGKSALAALPRSLVGSTANAALHLAAGNALTSGLVSAKVVALVEGVNQAMFLTKAKVATALLLALGLVATGTGVLTHQTLAAKQAEAQTGESPKQRAAGPQATSKDGGKSSAETTKGDKEERVAVSGKVLDPEGKPFPGVKLYLGHYRTGDESVYSVRATSGKDGRFAFTFKRSELRKTRLTQPVGRVRGMFTLGMLDEMNTQPGVQVGQLVAVADGHGFDWAHVDRPAPGGEFTLQLFKDVAVSGLILDKDGRPVTGAKIRVAGVAAYPGEDVTGALEEVRKKNLLLPGIRHWWGPLPGQPRILTTGADGRFRTSGFGRERIVMFDLEGPAIAQAGFRVMTRLGETAVGPGKEPSTTPFRPFHEAPMKLYGATFRYLAEASRPIRGVVRDKETGKPMAGVLMWAEVPIGAVVPPPGTKIPSVMARTDKEGRYELLGFPKSEAYTLYARPDTGRHFAVGVRFKDTPGLEPLVADLKVPGGVLLFRGKVTDKRSGKPVPGARVHYFPLYRNPETDKLADYARFESATTAGPDGSFTVAGLPGLGALAVVAPAVDAYRVAEVTPREIIAFYDKYKEPLPPGGGAHLLADSNSRMGFIPRNEFHVLSLIHPEKKEKEVKQDLVLQPF